MKRNSLFPFSYSKTDLLLALACAGLCTAMTYSSKTKADEPSASMSFQGYSGLINIPTATLFDEGAFHFQYGTQVETRQGYRHGDNYNFGIALWEYIEVSGRLAEYKSAKDKGPTDLSANVKFKVPFIPKDWFQLAVGIQDLGGAANYFDAQYAVATKTLFDDFNVSLGFGSSQSRQDRLNGFFAGIAWQPYEWAKVSVEYDAADVNMGLHLATPKHWLYQDIQLTSDLLVSSSNDELSDDFYYGFGIAVPLKLDSQSNGAISKARYIELTDSQHALKQTELMQNELADDFVAPSRLTEQTQVKQQLVKEGFESIKVDETDASTLYIELQNHVYNRNQLDGLGTILGIITQAVHYNYANFHVILKEREIPILAVKGSIADYVAFLRDDKPLKLAISTDTFSNLQHADLAADNSNNTWFKPRFTFWPGIVSRIGTELGVFDASLALISHVELPLWQGAAITAQHTEQIAETTEFEDDGFFAAAKQESGLHEYSFHQAFALPFSIKNMTSFGRYRDTYHYLSNEMKWQSTDGAHSVNLLTGKYENQEIAPVEPYPNCNILFAACWPDPEPEERDVMIAKYRYYNGYFDSSAIVEVGQYWQQDKGVKVKFERMFDDVSFSLTYKNTRVEGGKANELIGLGFSIPLTPRKDYSNKYFQVRGKPKWNYTVNTLIGEATNDLTPGTADTAQTFYNLDNAFYNNDRLGRDYIYKNAYRLKLASYNTNLTN